MKRTPIALLIEKNLAATNRSQKELASLLHDRCGRAPGANNEPLKMATFTSKLSKLMNDDPEGIEFFRKEQVLEAVSFVLEKPTHVVSGLLSVPTLIIHPRVSSYGRDCVRQQAEQRFGTSDWVLMPALPAGADHDETLALQVVLEARGDAARAVLVLVEPQTIAKEHRGAYATAQLPLGTLTDKLRGVEIVEQPELLPLPPPSPPRRVDTEGRLLYEVPELAAEARRSLDAPPDPPRQQHSCSIPVICEPPAPNAWDRFVAGLAPQDLRRALSHRLRHSLAREETPTFYPEEVLCWLQAKVPFRLTAPPRIADLFSQATAMTWQLIPKDPGTVYRPLPALGRQKLPQQEHPEQTGEATPTIAESLATALANEDLDHTYVWQHGGAFFVAGNRADQLNASLREHCPELQLRKPRALGQLAARLRERRNPHRLPESAWFTELSQQSLEECGLQLEQLPHIWHNDAALDDAESNFRYPHATLDTERSRGVREHLTELCRRHLLLTEEEAWIGLLLAAAARADVLLLHADTALHEWTAVLSLGVDGLWRLRFTRHPKDDPTPLAVLYPDHFYERGMRAPNDTHLDGGNVHLQLRRLPSAPGLTSGR